MKSLQEFYDFLDYSEFDKSNEGELCDLIKRFTNDLIQSKREDEAKIAELERQIFSIQKSFDYKQETDNGKLDGLSWQFRGTQTLESGDVIPYYWPNVSSFTNEEFEYFEERFKATKNLYAKSEYGLLVYFGKRTAFSKHKEFKQELFGHLFDLCNRYYERIALMGKTKGYTLYFTHCLETAFKIAEEGKLGNELETILLYIFNIHQKWDVKKEGTLRMILDLSGIMSENFRIFKKLIDFNAIILKNLEGAEAMKENNIWGAIYAINTNLGIKQKLNIPFDDLIRLKAELYEKMALDSEKIKNPTAGKFAEDALRLFKQIKSEDDIKRLEMLYSKLRGKFELTAFQMKISTEELEENVNKVKKTVADSSESDIISYLIMTPWYTPLDNIKEMAKNLADQSVLSSLIPVSIMDKFGNTVDKFSTDEEKKEYNFWNTYGFDFQLGTNTMFDFFIEAAKQKKLTFASTIHHLEKTWINEALERNYFGEKITVVPIDTIRFPLRYFFLELEKYFEDNSHQFDYVTITDSLTLKVEGLIRYFVERLGIPTFKTRVKGPDKLVTEKLLDDLLMDLSDLTIEGKGQKTNFQEDDRVLIKYVLTQKAGLNLRNKIAHGLLDIEEYSMGNLIVLICIIIKLSKYKFIPISTQNPI